MQGITQVIDAGAGRVQNIASFRLAGAVDGYLNVEGTVRPAQPPPPQQQQPAQQQQPQQQTRQGTRNAPADEAVRVNVEFTAFSLKVGALPALKIPLGWANPTVRSSAVR
jgi:hypothetical protein